VVQADYCLMVESLKIVCMCILAAVVFGIVHDQVTARICVEYFTVFHPPVFTTTSPTLLGLGWGVIATWWAGAIIGLLLLIAARFGSRPALNARDLFPSIAMLMAFMAICAAVFGIIGYLWAPLPVYLADMVPQAIHRRLLADWWAHSASYGSGFLGGLVLSVATWFRRQRITPTS
jgi:hypothetical protein